MVLDYLHHNRSIQFFSCPLLFTRGKCSGCVKYLSSFHFQPVYNYLDFSFKKEKEWVFMVVVESSWIFFSQWNYSAHDEINVPRDERRGRREKGFQLSQTHMSLYLRNEWNLFQERNQNQHKKSLFTFPCRMSKLTTIGRKYFTLLWKKKTVEHLAS